MNAPDYIVNIAKRDIIKRFDRNGCEEGEFRLEYGPHVYDVHYEIYIKQDSGVQDPQGIDIVPSDEVIEDIKVCFTEIDENGDPKVDLKKEDLEKVNNKANQQKLF